MESVFLTKLFYDIKSGTTEEKFIYKNIISQFINDKDFILLNEYIHHKQTSRLMHSLHVSFLSFLTAYRNKMDYVSVAIGGLLHDFCLFQKCDYKKRKISDIWCFYHPKEALKLAEKKFNLSEKAKEIISKHMFPMVFTLPKYKETYIIAYWDKYCAIREYAKKTWRKQKIKFI